MPVLRLLPIFALIACGSAPADGLLQSGIWGGDPEPQSLEVDSTGNALLRLACTQGPSTAPLMVEDGEVHATFRFRLDGGDADAAPPDTGMIDTGPQFEIVTLDVEVRGKRLDGEIEHEGASSPISLVLGAPRGLEVPCEPG